MSKHTPGPWRADVHVIEGFGTATQRVEIYAKSHLVAYYTTTFVEYASDSECEANARLMAAAPDLLDALEEARKIIVEACVAGGIPLPDASLARIDSAIAKAKGES